MKRVRSLLLACALALLALVIALWARSYWRLDVLSRVKEDGTTRAAASYQGAWHFINASTNARTRPLEWDAYRVPKGATYSTLHRVGVLQWQFAGFARLQTTPTVLVTVPAPTTQVVGVTVPPANRRNAVTPVVPWRGTMPAPTTQIVRLTAPPGGSVLPYGPSAVSPLVPWLALGPYDAVIVPYWAVAVMVGAVPLDRLRRVVRASLRRRRGCCIGCGYDLRGSGERCPECGRATA